ncbi:MAG: PD-(D/E)XK nuclease family protein [Elainellaceae cyanobacterium]
MPIRLSQSHLNLLARCPRQFQYTYLDQIGGIASESQQQFVWGNQFHQLMLQRDLGLPLFPLLEPELTHCMTALQVAAPHLFDPTSAHQSEYQLSLPLATHTLVVVYDRLVLEGNRATIYDWKTHVRPLSAQQLSQSWQTRLYLYLLAEVGDYAPEALLMEYWFVRLTPNHSVPTSVSLPYSTIQHNQTHTELTQQIQQLNQWLDQYDQQPLPQLPLDSPDCITCPFAVCCDRLPSQRQVQQLLSVEAADEVPL